MSANQDHDFHLVQPSCWPLLASLAAFLFFGCFTYFLHGEKLKLGALIVSLLILILVAGYWWRDIIKEAIQDHAHNQVVRKGLKIGMLVFIFSEVCIFGTFFSSFIRYWWGQSNVMTELWETKKALWPPKNLHTPDPWGIPLLNTFILLLSGTTTNWAHHSLRRNNKKIAHCANLCTIVLGSLFLGLQLIEYHHLGFSFSAEGLQAIYTNNFFIITGFHGAHVLIGLLFLTVCQIRMQNFTPENHLGFESAAWYWHFVDVLWILLFVLLYIASR